jgi:hypothetical protein
MQGSTTPVAGPEPQPDPPQGEICCEIGPGASAEGERTIGKGVMPRRARGTRALAGLAFLGLAGGLASRSAPGGVRLWPLAIVPTWFGVSHLVAAQMGYHGCPELGAIASVLQGRRIETGCIPWDRADSWLVRR